MSQTNLERVQADLSAMQEAVGAGRPFGWSDVWLSVALAGCGLLMAAWATFAPPQFRLAILLPLLLVLAAYAALGQSAGRHKGREPVRWREFKYNAISLAVITPLATGYLLWVRYFNLPHNVAASAAIFFVSLGVLLIAVIDPSRRHYIGSALPGMAFGLAIPFLSSRELTVAAGLCILAVGLLTAAIQAWLLRTVETPRAAD